MAPMAYHSRMSIEDKPMTRKAFVKLQLEKYFLENVRFPLS